MGSLLVHELRARRAARRRAAEGATGAAPAGADIHKGQDPELRRALIDAAREMNAAGVNQGVSGNLSARRSDGEGIWVTPSGRPYDGMTPGDLVALDWDAAWRAGPGLRPSSEWRFHRDILASRSDLGAVVHAHPIHATALSVHGRGIGSFHYMVALAGGADIRCAPYATFGSEELSKGAVAALDGRMACLLAHHGLIACGRDPHHALALAVEVETLAAQYLAACALGEPPTLSKKRMTEVLAKVASGDGYGSAPPGETTPET